MNDEVKTIRDARLMKRDLEQVMTNALRKFEADSGVYVVEIAIERVTQRLATEPSAIVHVQAELR